MMMERSSPAMFLVCTGIALAAFVAGFFVGGAGSAVEAAEPSSFSASPHAEKFGDDGVGPAVVRSDSMDRREAKSLPATGPSAEFLDQGVRAMERPPVDQPRGTAVISGQVTTPSGEPVAGVTVFATPARKERAVERLASEPVVPDNQLKTFHEVLTDGADAWAKRTGRAVSTKSLPDGSFKLTGLNAMYYDVKAECKGYRVDNLVGSVVHPSKVPDALVLFEAKKMNSVRVELVRLDGGPAIDQAVLSIQGEDHESVQWTRSNPVVYAVGNEFRLQARGGYLGLGGHRTVARFVSDAVMVYLTPGDPEPTVTLELEETCVVMGRVVGDRQFRRDRDVVLAVGLRDQQVFDPTSPVQSEARAWSRSGTFCFTDLRAGRYAFCVNDNNGIPATFEVLEVGPGVTEVTLERPAIDVSEWLAVTVRSPTGAEMKDVSVHFEMLVPGAALTEDYASSRVLASGVLVLDVTKLDFDYEVWPSGTQVWIVAGARGFGQARAPLTSGQRAVEVQLAPPCELEVTVHGDLSVGEFHVKVLEQNSQREDPEVLCYAATSASSWNARINRNGVVRFRGLAPGPVTVALSSQNRWWGEGGHVDEQEIVLRGTDHQIALRVPPTHDLAVLVSPCDKRRGVSILRVESDGKKKHLLSTQTTTDGRAVIRALAAGNYEVREHASGAQRLVTVPGSDVVFDLGKIKTRLTVSISDASGLLSTWGLAAGDKIVAINGTPVVDRDALMNALDLGGVQVSVERGEETLQLSLPRYPRNERRSEDLGGRIRVRFN